jgi:hypothetical protein
MKSMIFQNSNENIVRISALNFFTDHILSFLICTLISENQGLEKSRSASNLRKISGPANLDFFSVCHLDFIQIYSINLAFFLGGDLEKIQVCRT